MREFRELPSASRRRFLAGLVGVGTMLSAGRTRAAVGGPKVLVAGDSMIAGGFGVFLERALRDEHGYAVRRRGKSSTGLARPDFFDWIEEAKRLVATSVPDASVVMFGGNDVQGLYMGNGEWIRWHEPGWDDEYAKRINAFADILAPAGQRLFWVGMPVMRPSKFHERVKRVNRIYRAEMAIRPGATFIDSWAVLADEDGSYADKIVVDPVSEGDKPPKPVRVRAGDGIHLSPAGAHHLKRHVLEVVLPELAELA